MAAHPYQSAGWPYPPVYPPAVPAYPTWPHPSQPPYPPPQQAMQYPQPAPVSTGPEPVFRVRIVKHTGAVVLWQHSRYSVTGTVTQCEAAIRYAQQHNLLAGWWSMTSVLALNWIALLANFRELKRLRRNAAAVYAPRPADPRTAATPTNAPNSNSRHQPS